MSFADRLFAAIDRAGTPAMVGLDPRPERFPEPFRTRALEGDTEAVADAMIDYHRELLEVVARHAGVVKPQAAFFERFGVPGMRALHDACATARARGLVVVLDAKRGDIGSTSTAYAQAYFDGAHFPRADALTVNAYLGEDACTPFLEMAAEHDAGIFVLVKTSNPGAGLFQEQGDPPLADLVARAVTRWGESLLGACGWSSVGAVVGATRPDELAHFRALMPRTPILLPGFGFQGGTADGLAAAFDDHGHGGVVNASRSILFAHEREDLAHLDRWEDRVEAALREMVEALRIVCPVRRS